MWKGAFLQPPEAWEVACAMLKPNSFNFRLCRVTPRNCVEIVQFTSYTILPGVVQLLSFFPEKKMQHFRSITGAVEGVMLPPRVVRIDDEGRAAPAR